MSGSVKLESHGTPGPEMMALTGQALTPRSAPRRAGHRTTFRKTLFKGITLDSSGRWFLLLALTIQLINRALMGPNGN